MESLVLPAPSKTRRELSVAAKKLSPRDQAAVDAMAESWLGDILDPASNARAEQEFPFQVLGHSEHIYYFMGQDSRTVVGLLPTQMSKHNLMSLAPLPFWERMYGNRAGMNWDMAGNALLAKCHEVGIYDPSRIRGRGAWCENGKVILHLGDSIVSSATGIKTPIAQVRPGRYIYQLAAPMDVEYDNPLSTEEAGEILKIMEMISWEHPISAYLLAGWCVLAPVCGALSWRPHLWLSGSKGCGKSWIVDKIVRPLMGNLGLHVQSATTEAGIRQTLGHDALAVTFDEAESSSQRSSDRIQMVLELMRQASSDSGSSIVKGSASGLARSYKIRSCFLMSSIGVGIKQAADASRVSILSVVKRKDTGEFQRMQNLIASILTEDYIKRFIARSIRLVPQIRANATVFAKVAAKVLGSQRAGDHTGALLAGWYTLHRDDVITETEAEEWIRAQEWVEQHASEEESDEINLKQHILAHVIKIRLRSFDGERNIGELANAITSENDSGIGSADAAEILGRTGIVVKPGVLGGSRIIISNSHPGIAKILSGTQWQNNWARILKRIDGAEGTEPIRFGPAHRSRGVSVPLLDE